MANLTFKLNAHLYLRDPQHTELGLKIIRQSIDLIDRLGFEQFTFKKLSEEIDSTEASVYRYFENKHRLLHYLIAWYWSWIEYRIDLATGGTKEAEERLRTCLRVLAEEKKYDPTFDYVDEVALNRIVIAELDKTYLTKWVDADNKEGLFLGFKSLCKKIAAIILEVNPKFGFANSLASTALLAAKQQLFFAEHLPTLSSLPHSKEQHNQLLAFLEKMVFGSIHHSH